MTNKYTTCPAIDTALFLNTDGGVKVCCAGEGELGNIKDQTIPDIFNSPKVIEIKKSLDNHVFPSYCKRCVDQESIAPGSSQLYHFQHQNYPKVEYRQLQSIDLRWSNHCNLSCKYCGPEASSAWSKLTGQKEILYSNRDNKNSVLEEIKNNLDTIKTVMLLGGEPLLQKENEALFDIIKDRPEILVTLLTNASVDLTKNKIYNQLKKLKNVQIHVSMENVQERFEYIRYGASWKNLVQNLDIIKNDFGEVRFNPVYSMYNATRLKEYFKFVNNYTNNNDVYWSLIVKEPWQGFSVFEHNDQIKEMALREIEAVEHNFVHQRQIDFFSGVKNSIVNTKTIPDTNINLINISKAYEELMPYPKTFKDLWPELHINLFK